MITPESDLTVVIVPGLNNSSQEHWQSIWERKLSNVVRVQQRDWSNPKKDEWVDSLSDLIIKIHGPIVLVAHSLGCLTVSHLGAEASQKVSAALLVAPANPERLSTFHTFTPVPFQKLSFQSILVASTSDPYCPSRLASAFARSWGSELIRLNNVGHINVESGHGHWPLGWGILNGLCEQIQEKYSTQNNLERIN